MDIQSPGRHKSVGNRILLLNMFRPKLLDTLKEYNAHQFYKDLMAGLIVGVVALPLAIAFAIASGVSPEKGLYTAVIAGFIISALGGSRVQIGGPTGAFIVIVYGIIQQYGIYGLTIATLIAGAMLILMGLAKLGSVIKFIPYPLVVGFTSGIALIIFSAQVKDFLGLNMSNVPADFIGKWKEYFLHFQSTSLYATGIATTTVFIIWLWPRITHKIPGSLIAILLATAAVQFFNLPVETIGDRFGSIPSSLPSPSLSFPDFATIKGLIQPAFTIAMLAGIESLLSAVVADGMTGDHHRSNTELVAQGTANIFSAIFGGIPATGAIARTATNIRNGASTPVAGIVHALTLLLIMLFVGKWAVLIPMPVLAGILVMVAYNMSEAKHFISILKGSRSDIMVLLTTFFLTVLIDLTVAIEIGMLLAVFLFMRRMIQFSNVKMLTGSFEDDSNEQKPFPVNGKLEEVEIFEITGPLFFGAVYKFKEAIRLIEKPPSVLIIRMSNVSIIDATGIKALEEICHDAKRHGTKLILSEVRNGQVMEQLKKSRLLFTIGKANVTQEFEQALHRSRKIVQEKAG
jgi:sulfate permease, SulP family